MVSWTVILAVASPVVALASFAIAGRSLNLAQRTGQAAYEAAKADALPAVGLFLTEIEYRRATPREPLDLPGNVALDPAMREDADCLEVVVRGRLVNNQPQEMLLTCWDHANSGRTRRQPHRNQSVFIIDDQEVELGRALLPEGQTATFTWIDRRPRREWISIYCLHAPNTFNDPELELPRLTRQETVRARMRTGSLERARREKVARSGFQIVCEPRTTSRVATIWRAEVIQAPIDAAGRDEEDRLVFEERIEVVPGPLDDSVVHYRADFDPTLALINPPNRLYLPGRG